MPSGYRTLLWWGRLHAGLTQKDLALAIARRVELDVGDLFGADDLR